MGWDGMGWDGMGWDGCLDLAAASSPRSSSQNSENMIPENKPLALLETKKRQKTTVNADGPTDRRSRKYTLKQPKHKN